MKTTIKSVMDIIKMDYENGVEVSIPFIYKQLEKALKEEKQQLLEAFLEGEKLKVSNRQLLKSEDIANKWFDKKYTGEEPPFLIEEPPKKIGKGLDRL